MPSILLSGPDTEPITLDEAKAFVRVDGTDEDGVLADLIGSARVHVEAQTRRALITQHWRLVRDAWPPDGRVAVLPAPLRTLTAVRIYRQDGSTDAIDPAAFVADTASARLTFANGAPPAPGRAFAGIELDVEVGYGDAATDVPADLRQAIRLLLAHWYENRGVVALGQGVAALPETVAALIAPYRVLSL